MSKAVRRLYPSFHPESYRLELNLEPKTKSFNGEVIIDGIKVGRPSKRLTLHVKNLKVISSEVWFLDKDKKHKLKASRVNYHKSFDELRLHFKESLRSGRYQIKISYKGQINDQLQGIYLSTFKDAKLTKTIVCTQFESHHAREAFPCIDEPEAKSVFNLCLKVPLSLPTVIANTDSLNESLTKTHRIVQFAPTPKMSTYLLAFVAGEVGYLEAKTSNNIRVRTYATPANVSHGKFALDCAVKVLDFYEQYFAINYPLTKCDLVGLPDFASGAMENWGLITFREQTILVDPLNTSQDLKQYVANVVAHELTHQWFGNLVTMKWWNDLWLNEGFASWMSYLALDQIFPEWQVWTNFIVDEQSPGMRQDSLANTHPIEVKVNNPDEIRVLFDAISYEKGASVITMLQDYLGAETFRDGIRAYLAKHAYGNTETKDLWKALEEVSGKPVSQFMGRWTSQPGYPLLKTAFLEPGLHLEQQRFSFNPKTRDHQTIWPIPLFTSQDLGKNNPFSHRSLNVMLPEASSDFILNKGRRGFYRVAYDEQIILPALRDGILTTLPAEDRLGLIDDAFESAKGGYSSILNALNMLAYYFEDQSPVVWDALALGLGSLRAAMNDESLREAMQPFLRDLTAAQLKRLGLSAQFSDSHFDKLLRPTILSLASLGEEASVLKNAKELFYGLPPEKIDPDLRAYVYVTIARHGHTADFDQLLGYHNATTSAEERLKLTAALNSFKQPTLIKRALELIDSDAVRMQDVVYWISYAFSNHYSRDAAWEWLKGHWDWLDKNLGQDLSFYRMPNYVARCYSSLTFLKEYQAFFNSHLSAAFDRPLKQGVETIEWQAQWKVRDLTHAKQFFREWSKTHPV